MVEVAPDAVLDDATDDWIRELVRHTPRSRSLGERPTSSPWERVLLRGYTVGSTTDVKSPCSPGQPNSEGDVSRRWVTDAQ